MSTISGLRRQQGFVQIGRDWSIKACCLLLLVVALLVEDSFAFLSNCGGGAYRGRKYNTGGIISKGLRVKDSRNSVHSVPGNTFLSLAASASEGFEERIIAAIQALQDRTTREFKEMKDQQEKTNNEMRAEIKESKLETISWLQHISKKVDAYAHSMGKPFEEFVRGVLSTMLIEEIDDVEKIELNKRFADPAAQVHKDNATQVEIDIFCREPFIVAECKGEMSGSKGIERVHTFAKKKNFVEMLHSKKARGYLFAFTIDNDILQEVTDICKSNDIRLVRSIPADPKFFDKEK